uniref:Xylanase inhibitor C-terminal domain-containing protein n=1 Tax=Oryza brachyantha TaxID=4533 RepID=J3LWT5_ORYBR
MMEKLQSLPTLLKFIFVLNLGVHNYLEQWIGFPEISLGTEAIGDGFPKITFKFEGELTLEIYPYDYFFEFEDNQYCVGFQDASKDVGMGEDGVILGVWTTDLIDVELSCSHTWRNAPLFYGDRSPPSFLS